VALKLGLKVAIVEKEKLGGTCLHRGCIPTKSFLHSSELAHQVHTMGPLGLKVDGLQVDWPAVLKRKDTVVNQLWRGVEFLMKKNKIAVFKGQGSIESGNTVVVNGTGEKITAKQLLVATGSRPKSLPDLEIDGDRVINSDHAVSLEQMPRSIVIVGAGAVGTEFACVYNGYGAEVTLIEFQPTVLPLEDQEVGQQLAKVLAKRGIKVMTGAQVQPQTLKRSNGKMSVSVKSGDQTQVVEGERLLVAVGREGLTEGFGLEKLDLKIENGYIKTDEHYRTGHPNVYAAGDVIGNYLLAHVAYYEGEHVMEHIAGKNPKPLDYNRVPRATYSYPAGRQPRPFGEAGVGPGPEGQSGQIPARRQRQVGHPGGNRGLRQDHQRRRIRGSARRLYHGPERDRADRRDRAGQAPRVDPLGDRRQHSSAPNRL